MVTKFVALIFASFFFQDAVSSEQALGDIARAPHDDRAEAAVDQQNSGKIWNWTFGNTDSPATNEGKLKAKTPSENGFPANDRAFNVKRNPLKAGDNKMVADDNNAKESFLKKSRDYDARVDPRYSVPNRNLVKPRNQFSNNNRKDESEEYHFDESEDDDSFDSQSGSSQSYDDNDDDDDDDLSPENERPKGYQFSPDTRMRSERYPMRGSRAAPPSGWPPMEQPAMQTRSLQMGNLRGHPRRFGSVSM